VSVAYDTDLDRAIEVLIGVAAGEPKVQREPKPEVRHEGFGESAINLALVVWVAEAKEEALVSSNLRFAINRELKKAEIVMPFPQRDVHMRGAS